MNIIYHLKKNKLTYINIVHYNCQKRNCWWFNFLYLVKLLINAVLFFHIEVAEYGVFGYQLLTSFVIPTGSRYKDSS
jgi:hypothetical protein